MVGQLESTPTATVKGKSKVGKKLRSNTGVWDEGVTLSYQWTANGVPIAGATSPAYRIQAHDLGARIRLEVTGTKPNYAPVTTTSAPTAAIRKGTLKKGPRPIVKGKAKVGKGLRFTQGSWPQSGISFTYQWFVAAKPVAGAVGKRFKVKKAYRGKRIHVRVIGSKSGYHDRKVQSVRTARVR